MESNVVTYKARLMAKGNRKRQGVDYNKTLEQNSKEKENLEMRAPLIRSLNAIIRKIIVFICLGKWAKDGLKMEMLLL